MEKRRLSASIDANLLDAAEQAVKQGEAATVSAWVNDAMRLKLEHDARLHALADYIADYESQLGEITDRDIADAVRESKRRAISTRGMRAGESRQRYRR